jgi:hypothetical protein
MVSSMATNPARRSGVFIPCPACRRAIELPPDGKLPEHLTCPNCGRRITRRPSGGAVTGVGNRGKAERLEHTEGNAEFGRSPFEPPEN